MRYRRWSYRYTVVESPARRWPSGEIWQTGPLRLLVPLHWRPDTDLYETATTVEMIVDLAGVHEDDFEIQLFEDVLVVDGQRRIPTGDGDVVYHAVGVRKGPFRVEIALPAPVDAERVEAHYDRGVLRITLPKRGEAG